MTTSLHASCTTTSTRACGAARPSTHCCRAAAATCRCPSAISRARAMDCSPIATPPCCNPLHPFGLRAPLQVRTRRTHAQSVRSPAPQADHETRAAEGRGAAGREAGAASCAVLPQDVPGDERLAPPLPDVLPRLHLPCGAAPPHLRRRLRRLGLVRRPPSPSPAPSLAPSPPPSPAPSLAPFPSAITSPALAAAAAARSVL